MGRISSRNTLPEVRVRSVLHQMGFRFRLHRKDLPGKPDIVLPKWRTVILVHGCFWHGHENCCEGHVPKSNSAYWAPKLARKRQRDAENAEKLQDLGCKRLVIWECQTYSLKKIEERLRGPQRRPQPSPFQIRRTARRTQCPAPPEILRF